MPSENILPYFLGCRSGGIGRRAGFKIQFPRKCGFDSHLRYKKSHFHSMNLGFFYLLQMFTVYALKSIERNYIYVGLTNNLDRRVAEHNKGYNKTTKPYLPFQLIYTKSFPTRPEARIHEKYLKSSTGKRFLKSLV